jgi:hypothetical protein
VALYPVALGFQRFLSSILDVVHAVPFWEVPAYKREWNRGGCLSANDGDTFLFVFIDTRAHLLHCTVQLDPNSELPTYVDSTRENTRAEA